jgi:ferric-dicitrate binding protein FerR (iron transport regulator)
MEDQIYITMAKVLQGEATAAERAEFEAWLAADESHPGIYAQMKEVWAEADNVVQAPAFDTSAAWNKVASRLSFQEESVEEERVVEQKRGKTIAFPAWARYSSAIAAILVVAFLVWNPFAGGDVRIAAADRNMRVVLPDESVIILRKGSSLSYPKQFASNERKVALEGEAFFDVAHNERQPFVIDAQSVSVKVLGTSFNVQCDRAKADVSVTTGKVQVTSQSGNNLAVVLTPGNKTHYENGHLTSSIMDGYEAAWKRDTLSFNGTPLSTVIDAITAAKDTVVKADPAFSAAQLQQAITVSFPVSQPLEDMLTELCLIARCRWQKQGNTYLIRTK